VIDQTHKRIVVWVENDPNPNRTILNIPINSWSLFVAATGDIYVDAGTLGRVEKWTANSTYGLTVMIASASCAGLFADVINNKLYCSIYNGSKVITASADGIITMPIVVAGNGTSGSASNQLNNPRGIFVDINLDLYVADYGNKRVQLFKYGQLTGTTVAGNGAPGNNLIIDPTGIAVDADGYLYIVDKDNHRIVQSGPDGTRCLVGCLTTPGPALNQLHYPYTMAFDSYGNMFVTDTNNDRIIKFLLLSNSCGE
jgi:hypothetical protein